MEICTAAIRPCLELSTEKVQTNSASPTEVDLRNSAYLKWKTCLWPLSRIESPILSADSVIQQYNVRTRRRSVQTQAIRFAPLYPDFCTQQSAPKNSDQTGASSPAPTSRKVKMEEPASFAFLNEIRHTATRIPRR